MVFRWVANKSEFESRLYGLPIWNVRLEAQDVSCRSATSTKDSTSFQDALDEGIGQFFQTVPWGRAYVSAKLVQSEPVHNAFLRLGFREVERRRLYTCKISDIASGRSLPSDRQIQFTSLAAVAPRQLPIYHEQILGICQEAFDQKGYSRHFTDPVLAERLPGVAYILAAMELNFRYVAPERFLVAVDVGLDRVCGFSAVGTKPGLCGGLYTQLLSAVQEEYRGEGIYRGLTRLLSQTLPQESWLLNVTHVANRAIQRAYQGSGRVPLTDTVILRRLFHVDRTGSGLYGRQDVHPSPAGIGAQEMDSR